MAVLKLFISSYLNILLLAVPLGWAAHFANWGAIPVFVLVGC
jgi:hypothetical protein